MHKSTATVLQRTINALSSPTFSVQSIKWARENCRTDRALKCDMHNKKRQNPAHGSDCQKRSQPQLVLPCKSRTRHYICTTLLQWVDEQRGLLLVASDDVPYSLVPSEGTRSQVVHDDHLQSHQGL